MSSTLPQLRVPVSLRRLFPTSSFVGCGDIRVADATESSSECRPNVLFAAISGTRVEGSEFVNEAIQRGASALLVQQPIVGAPVPQCIVPDVRRAYAEVCSAIAGYPSRRLKVAGVTGTNGKTTVSWLIRSILQAAGKQTGMLGTVEYHDGEQSAPAGLTTPDSRTLAHWLCAMVCRRTTHAVMELSSHALAQGRAVGTRLEVAVITNVTQDHFDYHRNAAAYLDSKAKIFEHCRTDGLVVINRDDPGSSSLAARVPESLATVTYGIDQMADVSGRIQDESLQGSRLTLRMYGEAIEIRTRLVGRHNVSNILAAAAAARRLGATTQEIKAGIEQLEFVPGRLERVNAGQPFPVFVDYAHTEDALRRSIQSLKRLTPGRVLCVFGAGGDRDRSKRPLMGQAAVEADVAVITSDNPRTEDPQQIMQQILRGLPAKGPQPHLESDRYQAIQWALSHAHAHDSVLIAGKGHETEQIVGHRKFPFDDREVVREIIEQQKHLLGRPPQRVGA